MHTKSWRRIFLFLQTIKQSSSLTRSCRMSLLLCMRIFLNSIRPLYDSSDGLVSPFHIITQAFRFSNSTAWKQLFRSAWKDFNSNFQHILDDLARHKILVESRANIVQIQQAQASRAAARNSFAVLEEGQRKTRHLEVIGWLSAHNEVIDQEAAAKVRSDNPSSGKWLLQDSKVKAWMDTSNSIIPSLWMNGKPGAGK
jgi:hypothetical protein